MIKNVKRSGEAYTQIVAAIEEAKKSYEDSRSALKTTRKTMRMSMKQGGGGIGGGSGSGAAGSSPAPSASGSVASSPRAADTSESASASASAAGGPNEKALADMEAKANAAKTEFEALRQQLQEAEAKLVGDRTALEDWTKEFTSKNG